MHLWENLRNEIISLSHIINVALISGSTTFWTEDVFLPLIDRIQNAKKRRSIPDQGQTEEEAAPMASASRYRRSAWRPPLMCGWAEVHGDDRSIWQRGGAGGKCWGPGRGYAARGGIWGSLRRSEAWSWTSHRLGGGRMPDSSPYLALPGVLWLICMVINYREWRLTLK
jgi:hypothetical protein